MTIPDITWTTGEREVRGQTLRRGDEILAQVVGKLPMIVAPSERFRGMSVLELQLAVVSEESGQVELRETSAEELSGLLGFDFAATLDELGEASVGTRGDLLKDDGPGRSELCAVFRPNETVVPAVAWTLTRVAPLLAAVRSWEPRPLRPVLKRPAPRPVDLQSERRDGKA